MARRQLRRSRHRHRVHGPLAAPDLSKRGRANPLLGSADRGEPALYRSRSGGAQRSGCQPLVPALFARPRRRWAGAPIRPSLARRGELRARGPNRPRTLGAGHGPHRRVGHGPVRAGHLFHWGFIASGPRGVSGARAVGCALVGRPARRWEGVVRGGTFADALLAGCTAGRALRAGRVGVAVGRWSATGGLGLCLGNGWCAGVVAFSRGGDLCGRVARPPRARWGTLARAGYVPRAGRFSRLGGPVVEMGPRVSLWRGAAARALGRGVGLGDSGARYGARAAVGCHRRARHRALRCPS